MKQTPVHMRVTCTGSFTKKTLTHLLPHQSYVSACLPVCLSTCLSVYLSACLPVCLYTVLYALLLLVELEGHVAIERRAKEQRATGGARSSAIRVWA